MPESNTVSLVIPPGPSPKSQNLQSQIQQIILQKGHFRHVTERSLLAEIHGKASAADTAQQGEEDVPQIEEDEKPEKRTERLWERRNQMLEQLSAAQNEILCALDFMSWLISQQSVSARQSMSPQLKESAPVGSLAARVLEEKPVSFPVRRQMLSVSQGWRSEGFRSASEKSSAASSRLHTEAEHEAEFWNQVARCKAKGWPVSRRPGDRKAIGVHFGFRDSAPQFRARGFALLLQASNGSVGLDSRSLPKKRKKLAVFVVRDHVRTGAYYFQAPSSDDVDDISQQLTEHRAALFEEELFYEICRESRLIANQGVSTRAQTVEIDVGDYRIQLVSSDEQKSVQSTNDEDDLVAGFVAFSFRLLLNAAHEQNLRRRSQKAPLMANKARPTPEYALIRPILTHLRHRAEVRAFWTSCQVLLRPLEKASLPIHVSLDASAIKVFESLEIEPPATILSRLMVPAKTASKITLTAGQNLQVGLATFLGPPLLGSRYETSEIDFGFSRIPFSRHETRVAAMTCLRHVLLLDLVAHTQALMREPVANNVVGDSKQKVWSVSQPHHGEFTMYEAREPVHKMRISVQAESVSLKLSPVTKRPTSDSVIWTWTVDGCKKAEDNTATKAEGVTFDQAIREALAKNA